MGTILNALVKLQSVENNLRAAKAKLARCRRNVILKENQLRTQLTKPTLDHSLITQLESDLIHSLGIALECISMPPRFSTDINRLHHYESFNCSIFKLSNCPIQ